MKKAACCFCAWETGISLTSAWLPPELSLMSGSGQEVMMGIRQAVQVICEHEPHILPLPLMYNNVGSKNTFAKDRHKIWCMTFLKAWGTYRDFSIHFELSNYHSWGSHCVDSPDLLSFNLEFFNLRIKHSHYTVRSNYISNQFLSFPNQPWNHKGTNCVMYCADRLWCVVDQED